MPTRAFLLSNDEKALDAITQILSELEVSFELFHDPSFAVKRIASQHFELMLVDCDHEQNAAQTFGAIKKSGANQASITVAVADGKSGVANAFRLGATLVLAKPVSMEQARGTIRNALAMVRKSTPESKTAASAHTIPSAPVPMKTDTHVNSVAAQTLAPVPAKPAASPVAIPATPTLLASHPETSAPKPIEPAHKSPSNSLPLASAGTIPLVTETIKPSKTLSLVSDEHAETSKHAAPHATVAAAKEPAQRKTSPFLLTAVAVALVAAGVYGYSMMNPGFQSLLLSQYRSVQALTGLGPKPQPVSVRPKPAPAISAPAVAASEATIAIPDGFAATQPDQGFQPTSPAKSAVPVILNTSATSQKATPDAEPVVVPEDVALGHIANRVEPIYPEIARRKGVKGSVVLNAAVDKEGNVAAVEVASGNAQLASAAAAAVKQWRYQVYYHDGQPTEFQTQVTLQFPQPAHQ